MRIAYIFMSYPMAVQPWAISDVQALEAQGLQIEPYALRGKERDHTILVARHKLDLPATGHPSWRTAVATLDPRNLPIGLYLLTHALRHLTKRPVELLKTLALLPRLVEISARLRRDRPDVVHAFWGHYPSFVLLAGIRFFPEVHRSLFLGNYDLTPQPFGAARQAAAVADSVWTLAEANLPLLMKLGVPRTKITVARRGIPLDLADQPPVAKVPGRICTAANLQQEKNVDIVLRSFAEIARIRPDATLVVVGDGAERRALEALATELDLGPKVTFTGLLSRERVFGEMRRAEVFAFLSTKPSERLPNVVMEAMLAEAFCVASRTDDIEELVEPARTGTIVDDLTPSAVAAAIVEALAAPDRAAVGARAGQHIRERFSADAQMAIYARGWCAALERALKPSIATSGLTGSRRGS